MTQRDGPSDPAENAPLWHTALLVFVILTVNVTGAILSRGAHLDAAATPAPVSLVAAWVPLVVVEWGLLVYCVRVARERSALRSLLGRGWDGPRRPVIDALLAALLFALVQGAEMAFFRLFPAPRSASVAQLLPHTLLEKGAWLGVALSVGFCEEVVYRGYLLRQLAALTGRITVGVVLSAALFGIAHTQQGLATAARFAVYGVIFGIVARSRKSLVSVILAHVALDAAAGLLAG